MANNLPLADKSFMSSDFNDQAEGNLATLDK